MTNEIALHNNNPSHLPLCLLSFASRQILDMTEEGTVLQDKQLSFGPKTRMVYEA